MFKAIINNQYLGRLIVTHIRKLKRVQKLDQYSEVHKFACVYLKTKPNQLSMGALYHKMMQYGIKLSTKHQSETNINFKNCYLKINHSFGKNKTFCIIPFKIKIFVIKIILVFYILLM